MPRQDMTDHMRSILEAMGDIWEDVAETTSPLASQISRLTETNFQRLLRSDSVIDTTVPGPFGRDDILRVMARARGLLRSTKNVKVIDIVSSVVTSGTNMAHVQQAIKLFETHGIGVWNASSPGLARCFLPLTDAAWEAMKRDDDEGKDVRRALAGMVDVRAVQARAVAERPSIKNAKGLPTPDGRTIEEIGLTEMSSLRDMVQAVSNAMMSRNNLATTRDIRSMLIDRSMTAHRKAVLGFSLVVALSQIGVLVPMEAGDNLFVMPIWESMGGFPINEIDPAGRKSVGRALFSELAARKARNPRMSFVYLDTLKKAVSAIDPSFKVTATALSEIGVRTMTSKKRKNTHRVEIPSGLETLEGSGHGWEHLCSIGPVCVMIRARRKDVLEVGIVAGGRRVKASYEVKASNMESGYQLAFQEGIINCIEQLAIGTRAHSMANPMRTSMRRGSDCPSDMAMAAIMTAKSGARRPRRRQRRSGSRRVQGVSDYQVIDT